MAVCSSERQRETLALRSPGELFYTARMIGTPEPRRHWFHYSLRTLLVVILLASMGMSWLAVKMQRARKQRETVAAIVRSGGSVLYEYQKVLYEGAVHKSGSPVIGEPSSPPWLQNLLGQEFFHTVTTVLVYSDEGVQRLKELPQLQRAYLVGSQISDEGVQNLEACVRLQKLYLDGTQVTDEGVKKLRQALPNCDIER